MFSVSRLSNLFFFLFSVFQLYGFALYGRSSCILIEMGLILFCLDEVELFVPYSKRKYFFVVDGTN